MGFIETAYSGNTTSKDLEINSDLNLKNEYDLIGVKRFLCQDYLGALRTESSDNLQKTFNSFSDILYSQTDVHEYTSELFRIPSNIIAGSSITVKYTVKNNNYAKILYSGIYKYDPDTETKTELTPNSTATHTTETISQNITVSAGELYGFYIYSSATNQWPEFNGSAGIKICYDNFAVSDAIWEVITP